MGSGCCGPGPRSTTRRASRSPEAPPRLVRGRRSPRERVPDGDGVLALMAGVPAAPEQIVQVLHDRAPEVGRVAACGSGRVRREIRADPDLVELVAPLQP